MAFKYLSKEVLDGFDKYKYNSLDTSPLSKYVTHPFWNWLVEFFPKWVAPNVITLSGFLFLVLQFGVLTHYDYSYYASSDAYTGNPPVPAWVWLLSSVCMFLAHTLDGIDGKQARRTKTSGPLGELFDHGLDSLAALFMPIGVYSVFGRLDHSKNAEFFFLIVMTIMFTFILSHWEKYNTGVLYLPWGYDLSQIGLEIMYLVTYIGGYRIWKFDIGFLNIDGSDLFSASVFASLLLLGLPSVLYNIHVSVRDKTGKNLNFWEGIRPLIPSILLFTLLTVWVFSSPIDIVDKDPRIFYVATGITFSNIACRLMVSCMSQTRCQIFNWSLAPLSVIVIGVQILDLGITELYLLYAYAIFVTAAHLHYGICVVYQLADHLNIYVFSTEKPPLRKLQSNGVQKVNGR